MSLRVLLQENPRIIILASESHALLFRYNPSDVTPSSDGIFSKPSSQTFVTKCVVEFAALESLDLSTYHSLQASAVHGTLGLINLGADIFLCVITAAARVATVRPGENVQKILSVEFYCLNRNGYDTCILDGADPYSMSYSNSGEQPYNHGSDLRDNAIDHPCIELKKVLSGGTFYYSVDFDLTNRLQDRLSEGSAFDIDSLDEDYLWNAYMIDSLIRFRSRLSENEKNILDTSRMLTSAIRGFVMTVTISAAASPLQSLKSNYPSTLTVLSRLSCRRAGTRFNSRGLDDDGYVANFVESETVLWHPSGLCFSYAQVRGSVPIFWEQATGLLPNQQKIQITRSPEATQPAFNKHFEQLELTYGTVHILNLMSATKVGEVELTARYQHHTQQSPLSEGPSGHRLIQSHFDFHAETKGPSGYEAASMVRRLIQDKADSFAYLLCDTIEQPRDDSDRSEMLNKAQSTIILQQQGVFRVNCLDCLDRTNLIQTILSHMAIELFLSHRSERAMADFWMRHSSIWADNGDVGTEISDSWNHLIRRAGAFQNIRRLVVILALEGSRKYLRYAAVGTGALKSSFTRHGKMSLAGAIADARKSATRMYINNFADKGRQNTVDMLLGRLVEQHPVYLYDPVNDFVDSQLRERAHEYTTAETIDIYAGTFNLNGKGANIKQDLSAWLCPRLGSQHRQPEIVAVGFQEMVELSPQQIMSTDPSRRQVWEQAVGVTINNRVKRPTQEEYVLLRSGQLVGAALLIFVKSSALKKIKNVEGSVKKTGMSGMAGNKGAVAIRMDYGSTRICFVTAHLAAGFANYEERNRDYSTISHGLRFQRNRSIDDHDTVIWLGDFNYRIGLSDDKVRRLIQAGDLGTLYQNDQLNLQMIAGHAFPYYSESQITFMPTYKYDNGTDEYDTSEKARIPAWCDRILRKGNNVKQIEYATAPLRFSDHRPVYATFKCTVQSIDEKRKEELSQSLYERRKPDVTHASANGNKKTLKDHASYRSVAAGLPPASSDRRKWWLDHGLSARSQAQPPQSNMVLNPMRPPNPFTATNESDWIMVGRSAEAEASERKTSTPPSRIRSPLQPPDRKPEASSRRSTQMFSEDVLASPTLPSPRRSSTASTAAGVRRKPAPPVPKKPPLLSRSGTGPSDRPMQATEPNPAEDDFRNGDGNNASSPSPSSWKGLGTSTSPARPSPFTEGGNKVPWAPPSSSQPRALPTPGGAEDRGNGRENLLDQDDEGAKTIPSLQPLRPQ
ncbi:Inositol-1,4,5-trisphosphate 5-phosphatase 1 [Xanthoria calcicola]